MGGFRGNKPFMRTYVPRATCSLVLRVPVTTAPGSWLPGGSGRGVSLVLESEAQRSVKDPDS